MNESAMSEIDNYVERMMNDQSENVVKEKYMSFIKDYSSNDVFGFVEGPDDISYYKNLLKNKLPTNINLYIYCLDGKKRVKKMYDYFNKLSKYSKSQVCFFIDRDLSECVPDENHFEDDNVYVTDFYSIENCIISEDTFRCFLQEVCHVSDRKTQQDFVDKFTAGKSLLEKFIFPIMLLKIISKGSFSFNDVKLKEIFKATGGKCYLKYHGPLKDKISRFCTADYDLTNATILENYRKYYSFKSKIIRGKFVSEFFLIFFRSFGELTINKPRNVNKKIQVRNLQENVIMTQLAPRCRIPKSLETFFNLTYSVYINSLANTTI